MMKTTSQSRKSAGTAIVGALLCLCQSAQAHEPPGDLLAHFTFDGTLADASGNGFNGEALGKGDTVPQPSFVDGKYGQGIQLNGDWAVIAPLDLNPDQYPEVTVTGWVFLENEEARGALLGTGSGDGPNIRVNGDTAFIVRPGGGRNQANNALRPGRWFFFAGTWDFDGGNLRLNWRARSQTQSFDPAEADPPAQDTFIGALNDGLQRSARGLRLDDVRIYARRLAPEELAGLQLGPTGDGPGESRGLADSGVKEPLTGIDPEDASPTVGAALPDKLRERSELEDSVADQLQTDTASEDGRRVVVFDGSAAPNKRSRYTLVARGDIRKAEGDVGGFDATINDNDTISGQTATGLVGSGVDAYNVDDDIVHIDVADYGAMNVYLDGNRLSHRVVFDGTAEEGRTEYTLYTTGELIPVEGELDGRAVTINPDDTISGQRVAARGYVGSARDGYLVFGDIEKITLKDPTAARIYINGQRLALGEAANPGGMVTIHQPLEPTQRIEAHGKPAGLKGELDVDTGSDEALYVEIAAGEYVLTEVSGKDMSGEALERDRFIKADLVDNAMHSITWREENDRPCEVIISGYAPGMNDYGVRNTATERTEFCNGDGGNSRSEMSVTLRGDSGVIRELKACTADPVGRTDPTRRRNRVKGLEIRGETLTADGRLAGLGVDDREERANCEAWHESVACPGDRVATGVRQHVYTDFKGNYALAGLQLICRRIAD
ncbi:LamG-like jellyroll fold domain-containing protein [Lentisalinibacter salinarum]|uniref:LamG-like jellyroll fold domain-containing protein n=1 Tax=Lentisalinibacter salinarum TaxID=2992239 RepID=UPI0038633BD4